MVRALGEILGGFADPSLSANNTPQAAGGDVTFFVTDRKSIPVSMSVLEVTEEMGLLADCPGGELRVLETSPSGDILGSSWAARLVVATADGSAITYRACRGAVLTKICKAALGDMRQHGDAAAARRAVVDSGRVPRVIDVNFRTSSDLAKLHQWAVGSLRSDLPRITGSASSGGLGFPVDAVARDGVLRPTSGAGTPRQVTLAELASSRSSGVANAVRTVDREIARLKAAASPPGGQVSQPAFGASPGEDFEAHSPALPDEVLIQREMASKVIVHVRMSGPMSQR